MKAATRFGPKHNSHYPWDLWFARSASGPVELIRGRDFSEDCLPSSLGVMLRVRMRARRIRRTVLVTDDSVTVRPPDPKFRGRGPKRKG